jgi:hypothetical protein
MVNLLQFVGMCLAPEEYRTIEPKLALQEHEYEMNVDGTTSKLAENSFEDSFLTGHGFTGRGKTHRIAVL